MNKKDISKLAASQTTADAVLRTVVVVAVLQRYPMPELHLDRRVPADS